MDMICSKRGVVGTNQCSTEYSCLVLMSSYNGEKYIKEQVESIINQKNVEVHLVVRDDGSTDNTLGILYEMKQKDLCIDIVEGKNVGIHKSFYCLMQEQVLYPYIAFSDQDDIWDEDKLFIAIDSMKKMHADFYSSAARLVDQNNKELGITTACPEKYHYYMNGNSKMLFAGVQGCTMVLTKELFIEIRSKKIPVDYGHDTWLPIVSYYLTTCIYDPVPHMNYRQHGNSWTGDRSRKTKQFYKEFRFYINGLKRYKPLANDILIRFENDLTEIDIEVLSSIANKASFFKKMRNLFRYKIGKYGLGETILFKIYYLFS